MTFTRRLLRAYGYTTVFSLAIAGLLWTLDESASPLTLVVVSCSIGFSIATAFVILQDPLLARLDALYHGTATLTFTTNRPHGVRATMTLPMRPDAERTAG